MRAQENGRGLDSGSIGELVNVGRKRVWLAANAKMITTYDQVGATLVQKACGCNPSMNLHASEPEYTSRLQDFDYGQPGVYFMTVCTADRIPWFGEIDESGMRLSEMGQAVQAAWNAIPSHFPDVRLDEFCVMPDHVHGLLEIHSAAVVGTQNFASLRRAPVRPGNDNKFGSQSRNLASIVRGFKIGVTKSARAIDPLFRWQNRYWDRVVRNGDKCDRIRHYIRDNPVVWCIRHRTDSASDAF